MRPTTILAGVVVFMKVVRKSDGRQAVVEPSFEMLRPGRRFALPFFFEALLVLGILTVSSANAQDSKATVTTAPQLSERVTFFEKPKPLPKGAVTHDWQSFLGPTHNAISTETKLLKKWPKGGPKRVWQMEKGTGYTSPAIKGDRLVFPHRVDDEVLVECLHAETGKQFWQYRFKTQYADRYGYNNGPRASPVIHGDRVFIYDAEGWLICLGLESGDEIWKRDLSREYNVRQDFFGVASTPLIEGNLLIVSVGAPQGPSVVALNPKTGKNVWQGGDHWAAGYSSPVAATIHGQRKLFVFSGGDSRPPTGGLRMLDAASGKVDFEFPWRSDSYESVNASSPVVVGNQVLISASYDTGSALLDVGKDFQNTTAWKSDKVGTHWNTAVHKDGYLYAFDGRNEPDASLVCMDRKTGDVKWRTVPEWEESIQINGETQEMTLTTFRGSLLAVDGHFLCLGEMGHLLWLDLTPRGYKEMNRTWLFTSQETWALPVLSKGLLYICQNRRDSINKTRPRLICYDLRAEN
jgi:outer membrane protein assembly factor BamB